MRKGLCLLLAVLMLLLAACNMGTAPTEMPQEGAMLDQVLDQLTTQPADTPTTGEPTTQPPTTGEPTTEPVSPPEQPAHSALYIPNVETEDVITWFNEVVLDAEFVNDGAVDVVQKWNSPVYYALLGAPTPEDETLVANMAAALNGISGFPGMHAASDPEGANLKIHFVSNDEMINILGNNFSGCDGGVTIWWNGNQQIYEGVICVRTDLDQYVRNSVIQEEIYNGLGPLQDTDLRTDSLIYSGYSTPQQMTQVDLLILQLLYHPDIRCGMTAAECETVIRQLYY